MIKKRLLVVLAVMMAVVLTISGCAKKSETKPESSVSEETKEESKEESKEEEPASEEPSEESKEESAEEPAEEEPAEEASEEESSEALEMPSAEEIQSSLAGAFGGLSEAAEEQEPEESGEEEDLDLTEIPGINLMRGGLLPNIEKVEPTELTEDQAAEMDRAMRAYTPGQDDLIINNAEEFYFYDQLTSEQQNIYEAFYLLGMDPTTTNNIVTIYTDQDPKSPAFLDDLYLSWLAIGYDHPEMWWISFWNGTYNVNAFIGQPQNGHNTVMLQMDKAYENFEEDVKAFNKSVEDFMADIDPNGTDEEIALEVHDKLIEMAIYDYDTLSKLDSGDGDLAHTAYGPFVSNTAGQAHYCVCDGYSRAYEYILQQYGIMATVVTGMASNAGPNGEMVGHAWSIVKIDDKWYEVDSTWDDMTDLLDQVEAQFTKDSLEYEVYSEVFNDTDYMNLIEHAMYKLMTAEIENYKAPSNMTYKTKDGVYKISMVSDSNRSRFCDYAETSSTFQGHLTELLPVADGTLAGNTNGGSSKEDYSELAGLYYITQFNDYTEDILIYALGEEYYKDLSMFELRADGSGTLMEQGQSIDFTFTFDGSELVITGNYGGQLSMNYENGNFWMVVDTGDRYVFAKME